MFGALTRTLAATGAGAVAIQLVQYGDMAFMQRKASDIPSGIAIGLARFAGVDLNDAGDEQADLRRASRREAIGELLGFATLLTFGLAYGAVRRGRSGFRPLTGAAFGLGAMASTEVLASALGVTDVTEWTPNEWASELAPHLAYGFVLASVYARLAKPRD